MRLATLIALAVIACAVSGRPAAANGYAPWCLKAALGNGTTFDFCYFNTFEGCAQERFFYGTTSFCTTNPAAFYRYGEPGYRLRKSRRVPER